MRINLPPFYCEIMITQSKVLCDGKIGEFISFRWPQRSECPDFVVRLQNLVTLGEILYESEISAKRNFVMCNLRFSMGENELIEPVENL